MMSKNCCECGNPLIAEMSKEIGVCLWCRGFVTDDFNQPKTLPKWIEPSELDEGASPRVLVKDPRLLHGDFNTECIAEGVLYPTNEDGTRDAVVATWDGYQDCFESTTLENVKQVMELPK